MRLFINGEAAECEIGLTIEQLVRRYGLSLEATLVEHNGVALHRREWPEHSLGENDRIEILRVAAGG
jgi:thiamine biosynthesis protein ThiS